MQKVREMVFLKGNPKNIQPGQYQVANSAEDLIVFARAGYFPRGMDSEDEVAQLQVVKDYLLREKIEREAREYKDNLIKKYLSDVQSGDAPPQVVDPTIPPKQEEDGEPSPVLDMDTPPEDETPQLSEEDVKPSQEEVDDAFIKKYETKFPTRKAIRGGKETENFKEWKKEQVLNV